MAEIFIETFKKSPAYEKLTRFIQEINECILNVPNNSAILNESKNVTMIVDLLSSLRSKVDEFPAVGKSPRFGHPAFRDWYAQLLSDSTQYHSSLLPANLHESIPILEKYFFDSFGNPTRLDYGSGHELAFVAWLLCLHELGFLPKSDFILIPTRIITAYLELVRKLQTEYTLEAAGSHGVWGLDDFQFLPYYWGAGQLLDHAHIKPKSIMQREIVEHFAQDYLYLGCINFINETKKGVFAEHSPMLYDISGVPNWTKVNRGLFRMYIDHVLSKYPVMQHFAFTKILSLE